MLGCCGRVVRWKRTTDVATGKPKGFGFVDFQIGAEVLRARRLLPTVAKVGDVPLLLKVDAKAEEFLKAYEPERKVYLDHLIKLQELAASSAATAPADPVVSDDVADRKAAEQIESILAELRGGAAAESAAESANEAEASNGAASDNMKNASLASQLLSMEPSEIMSSGTAAQSELGSEEARRAKARERERRERERELDERQRDREHEAFRRERERDDEASAAERAWERRELDKERAREREAMRERDAQRARERNIERDEVTPERALPREHREERLRRMRRERQEDDLDRTREKEEARRVEDALQIQVQHQMETETVAKAAEVATTVEVAEAAEMTKANAAALPMSEVSMAGTALVNPVDTSGAVAGTSPAVSEPSTAEGMLSEVQGPHDAEGAVTNELAPAMPTEPSLAPSKPSIPAASMKGLGGTGIRLGATKKGPGLAGGKRAAAAAFAVDDGPKMGPLGALLQRRTDISLPALGTL